MSIVTHFSLAQYERMVESGVFSVPDPQRVELIRGEIREMGPIGPRHAKVVDRLTRWSCNVTNEDEIVVRIQGAARIPELDSEPEPDVIWMINRDYGQKHPEPADIRLLIEVADSSQAMDLREKMQLYAEAGIVDYWVVDLKEDRIHVFREPTGRDYSSITVASGDDTVRPLVDATVGLKVSELLREGKT